MRILLSLLILAVGGIWVQAEGNALDTSEENMKRIARSLGVECTHCHLATDGKIDYEAPTPEAMKSQQLAHEPDALHIEALPILTPDRTSEGGH